MNEKERERKAWLVSLHDPDCLYVTHNGACDCLDGMVAERAAAYAQQETWRKAFTVQCVDCAEGDEPTHDAQARWFYHGEGRNQVGCSASKLRLEAAANSVPKDSEGEGENQ